MDFKEIKKEFNSYGLLLIVVGIVINWVGAFIAQTLKLPVWLDVIGTMLVAVLSGPWTGAVAGAATNIIKWVTFDPVGGPYFVVNMAVGLLTGYLYKIGRYNKKSGIIDLLGVTVALALISTAISAPITVYIYGGVTGGGVDLLTALFLGTSTTHGLLTAVIGSELLGDIMDKAISVFLVFAIMNLLPDKYFKSETQKKSAVEKKKR
ncbi:ECF transporter, substrate-specific component [Candidatus Tiddalikarchaeum anstoanum]|nr:ECF transporter, substrate-specific component [Candidatus Tiddalikarchaeum anstoanum]